MANLVITSTTNSIKVVFNDSASVAGMNRGVWAKDEIAMIKQLEDDRIEVQTKDLAKWTVSYTNGSNFLVIDSVDGVAPTNNDDLFNKLSALIA